MIFQIYIRNNLLNKLYYCVEQKKPHQSFFWTELTAKQCLLPLLPNSPRYPFLILFQFDLLHHKVGSFSACNLSSLHFSHISLIFWKQMLLLQNKTGEKGPNLSHQVEPIQQKINAGISHCFINFLFQLTLCLPKNSG
jgi:hypothetical protein